MKSTQRRARKEAEIRASSIDYSKLPRIPVESKEPSLREIFLLGWQYFLPRLPNGPGKRNCKQK